MALTRSKRGYIKLTNYFKTLNEINVNDKTEKKGGLTYLSWAWAWAELKKLYPESVYTIYENAGGLNYHTDGRTCWVKTGVTVNGIEHIEYLPVMDYTNRSIPLDAVTSFDVNKAIQRSLTKAVARHGLGLYIYAGEDLPDEEREKGEAEIKKAASKRITAAQVKTIQKTAEGKGVDVGKILDRYQIDRLEDMTAETYAKCLRELAL